MTTDLKDTLRDWLDGDTPIGRDKVEILRAAGLIAPVGYQITEIGRTLMIQNPPAWQGDVDEPPCGVVNSTFGKLGVDPSLTSHPTNKQLLDDLTTMAKGITATGQVALNKLLDAPSVNSLLGSTDGLIKETAKDVQIGGDHYKKLGHHQPWEVLATWMTPEELRGYMKGTVIAYLAREQEKGGDTDIAKALHTVQLWQEVRKDK